MSDFADASFNFLMAQDEGPRLYDFPRYYFHGEILLKVLNLQTF